MPSSEFKILSRNITPGLEMQVCSEVFLQHAVVTTGYTNKNQCSQENKQSQCLIANSIS